MPKKNYPYYRLLLNDKDEWHLFGVIEIKNKDDEVSYRIKEKSICEKMNEDDRLDESKRLKEQSMREHSASIGKQVCGSCISHLYLTPKE